MENWKNYRDDLAKELRSEPDHEKRRAKLKSLLAFTPGSEYYNYAAAKDEKLKSSEHTNRNQVLFVNDREKKKALESLSMGIKTHYFHLYIPQRLSHTLLGKVLDQIDIVLLGFDNSGYDDLYDFLSSVPVGVDLSKWAVKVAEELNVPVEEEVKVGLVNDPFQNEITMKITGPMIKDTWANIGGIEFEKSVIPGERVGGNIRDLRESNIFDSQSEWLPEGFVQKSKPFLQEENLNIDEMRMVHEWHANPFASREPYDEEVERQELESLTNFFKQINNGSKFRLQINSNHADPHDSDAAVFWITESISDQTRKNFAGDLYLAYLHLEDDRKSTCPFPLFLTAGQFGYPKLEEITYVYTPQGQSKKTEIKGKGCRMRDLFIFLKENYGDQFVGVF